MRAAKSAPSLAAARVADSADSPTASPKGLSLPLPAAQVVLRREGGVPLEGALACWAASLRQYDPAEPARAPAPPTGQTASYMGGSRGFEYVRDPDPREELGLGPSLLKTFSSAMDRENDMNAAKMRALGLPQAPSLPSSQPTSPTWSPVGSTMTATTSLVTTRSTTGTASAFSAQLLPESEYHREAERLAQCVEELRARHAAFEPDGRRQMVKSKSSGDLSSKRGNPRMLEEDWSDRVQAWKYCRKIEPELPPLQPLESLAPPASPVPKDKVLANSDGGALARHRPEERLGALALRASDLRERQLLAADRRRERKAARLEALREDARRNEGRRVVVSQRKTEAGIFEVYGGQKPSWLVALAVGAFSGCLKSELAFAKLRCREQHEYLERHAEALEHGAVFVGAAKQEVLDIREKLAEPALASRLLVLSCMLACKRRRRERKAAVEVLAPTLHSWMTLGKIFVSMKKVAWGIKRIQRQWREWRQKLRKILVQVTARWLTLERQVIAREIREEQNRSKVKEVISYENQILIKRVEEGAREHFLVHELRARRYQLLPRRSVWEDEYNRWTATAREHHALQECVKFVGGVPDEELPLFLLPPPEPSYLPDDAELLEMLERARRGKDKHLKVPQDRAAEWIIYRKGQDDEMGIVAAGFGVGP